MSRNAHASSTPNSSPNPPSKLAYQAPCKYCDSPIYVAICSDGKWRSFETATIPAGDNGVWAWRKHQGMQETDMVAGHGLHFCAQFAHIRNGFGAFSKDAA